MPKYLPPPLVHVLVKRDDKFLEIHWRYLDWFLVRYMFISAAVYYQVKSFSYPQAEPLE